MADFTLKIYKSLLAQLSLSGYSFLTFKAYLELKNTLLGKWIILRHDVDRRPENSLIFAKLQREMDIRGTYYFRTICQDPNIIREIASMGHEVGYHYEDVNLANPGDIRKVSGPEEEVELAGRAYESFKDNLRKLREIVPVHTICMHGSPLSRWDNRIMWKYFDFRDQGILGEPYFDIDFNEVLYLTDSGRRWNGDKFIVRDKVKTQSRLDRNQFRFTRQIMNSAGNGNLPDKILMTFHPQRWTDKPVEWIIELLIQNTKNIIKRMLIRYRQ